MEIEMAFDENNSTLMDVLAEKYFAFGIGKPN